MNPSVVVYQPQQQKTQQTSNLVYLRPFVLTHHTTSIKMRFSILSAALFAATALAFPTVKRQSSTTCGSNYYSSSQVSDALNQGYNYYSEDEQVGSDDYPHTYNNVSLPIYKLYYSFESLLTLSTVRRLRLPSRRPIPRVPDRGGWCLLWRYDTSITLYIIPSNSADFVPPGSPGADRVVFNSNGEYAGAITHTGASGNDFVGCSGTS